MCTPDELEIAGPEGQSQDRDYDAFFLGHLQSIQGNSAWYLNQRFIGKDGNGTTFFVTCTSGINYGVQFVLKVFHKISDEQRRVRFHILRSFFKAGERQYPFAVIDYMPENLEQKFGWGRPQISRIQVLRYIMNIASGISYLHSQPQPIVHRDIKPANVLINGPKARLGDLGLAKVSMEGGDDKTQDVAAYVAMPRFLSHA